jgi:hypothetical protein
MMLLIFCVFVSKENARSDEKSDILYARTIDLWKNRNP